MSAKVLGVPSVLASAVLLAACGGGGGGSGGGTQNATVTGVAAKGILIGALVEACADMDCREVVDQTTTSTDGRYQLRLPVDEDYVIRVRYTDDAQMICDLPSCGDDGQFGDTVPMPSDINLRSVAHVDRTSQDVSAHVTPLTELVMIAAQVSNAGAIAPPPKAAVEKGQEAVLTLLGIQQPGPAPLDLMKLAPVNITEAEDLKAATPEQRDFSLISAAFGRMDDKTAHFISDFGAAFHEDFIIQEERRQNLKETLDKLNKKTGSEVQIAPQETAAVAPTPVQDAQRGQLSQNALAVRDLVKDVRTVGIEIYNQYQDEEKLQSGLIGQVQNLEDFAQDAIVWNFDALADINDVISNGLIEEYANDPQCALQCQDTPISVDLQTDLGAEPNINGTLNRNGNRWTLTNGRVDIADQGPIDVTLEFTVPKILGESQFDFKIVSASSEGLGAKVNLSDAYLTVIADKPFTEDQLRDDIPVEGDGNFLRRMELGGQLALEYTGQDQSLAFQGSTEFIAATNNNMIANNTSDPEIIGDTLLPVSLRLDGRFHNRDSGEYLEAEVLVTLDNADEYSFIQDQDPVRFEDEDRFPLATMQVKTAGQISHDLPEMDVLFRVQRTDQEAANVEFILGWNDFNGQTDRKFLKLDLGYEGDAEDLSLTATNASGATFELWPRSEYVRSPIQHAGDDVVGHVFIDGARHATIREESSNVYIITYHFDKNGNRDDSTEEFESLF